MATPRSGGHVAFDRVVFTYQPEGVGLGLVTGFIQDGCFFIEHVHVFPGAPASTLVRMLRTGMEMVWAYGCTRIAAHHTHTHPLAQGLDAVARRFGMRMYHDDIDARHWAIWSKD